MKKFGTLILGLIVGFGLFASPAMAATVKKITYGASAVSTASVKATPGQILGYSVFTPSGASYLQFFDTSTITFGTTVPIWEDYVATTGLVRTFPFPLPFGTAIYVGLSTASASGSTASATITLIYN